jgi:CHAT domain-containing protein/Tfp pilus assembly protein PilF
MQAGRLWGRTVVLCATLLVSLVSLESAPLQQAPDDPNERFHALLNRGHELRRQGKFDESAAQFIAARAIAERLGDERMIVSAMINLSSARGQQGDYPTTLDLLNEALARSEALHDNGLVASSLVNLAIVYRITGDYDRALATNRRSLELAVAAKDLSVQGRLHTNISVIYWNQGHFREALAELEQAEAIKKQLNEDDIGLVHNNFGNIYAQQGVYDLALEYYERALADLQKSPDPLLDSSVLGNIGTIYRDRGDLDRAQDYFTRAYAAADRVHNSRNVATATYNLATVQHQRGNAAAALEGHRRSLALRESTNDKSEMSESYLAIGHLLFELKRDAEGLENAERAATLAREIKSGDRLWEPLMLIGDLKRRLNDLPGAEAALRESIDTIEESRGDVAGGTQSRWRYFAGKLDAYDSLTDLLIAEKRTGDAFAVAERGRARELAEVLDADASAVRPLTDEERQRQQTVERAVLSANTRLTAAVRTKAGAAAVRDAEEQVRKARLAAEEFRGTLDARYPVRRLTRGSSEADLQASLADLTDTRTAIVEFAVTNTVTHVFVASRNGTGAPVLNTASIRMSREDLGRRVTAFRAKLAARSLDFHDDARALYDLLLKPVAPAIGARTRLVVVPDDVLWTIPFEALEPAPNRSVIDSMTIAYAPSIAVLRVMRDRQRSLAAPQASPLLAVAADPVSDRPRLPEAELQASALAVLYGAPRTRLLVGAAATEPKVRSALAEADVLHFATHGVVDDQDPMYSFLQLTRGGANDAAGDGRLEAWEIQSLKLRAAVAVLTACDTARGTIGGGEGVIGLAWSFLAAGTPSMVVSLWQLDAASATALTSDLHEHLRRSMVSGHIRVADSLRDAALTLRSDPRYRHPYYWAGLVAVGDGY